MLTCQDEVARKKYRCNARIWEESKFGFHIELKTCYEKKATYYRPQSSTLYLTGLEQVRMHKLYYHEP
jgi:hypothetical protein